LLLAFVLFGGAAFAAAPRRARMPAKISRRPNRR
jgi:hypothetical protein